MSRFRILETNEVFNLCKSWVWKRRPQEIHIHHTWVPNHSHFHNNNYIPMQESMEKSHLARGFSEIGQHLTLAPDGKWVTGRSFDLSPASIKGRNSRGFAIEMWGDFDKGQDKLEGAQLEAIISFCAFMMKLHKLNPKENIKFHREYASKSCPGTGVDKDEFINLVILKMEENKVEKIALKLNGEKIADAIKIDDVTYVPVRVIGEELGLTVKYDSKTKTVSLDGRPSKA